MARYLITGGTGFVGKALAEAITAEGQEVIIATRGRHDIGCNDWVEYDLRDRSTISNIIEARPDGIYHLAWSSTPGSAEADASIDLEINLAGTVALFQELKEKLDVPLMFLSSGGTVYGTVERLPIPEVQPLKPTGVYGMTKAAAENYATHFCARHGLDVRIARLANPFGAKQSAAKLQGAASIFARKIVDGEEIVVWGDGHITRDYIDVKDAVLGLIAIMKVKKERRPSPLVFNVGSGEGMSLNELIKAIGEMAGIHPKVTYREGRSFDIPANILDITKIRAATGWKPRQSTQDALRRMVAVLKGGGG